MRQTLIIAGIALAIIIAAAYAAFMLGQPVAPEPATGRVPGVFERLFPFNQAPGSSTLVPGSDQEPGSSTQQPAPRLRKVSETPVSGGRAFTVGATTTLRWVERATGHVYEGRADETTVRRVSNTTIPETQEVMWVSPTSFIIRSLAEERGAIQNFYATLASTTAIDQALSGKFLGGWDRAALDPDEKNLLSVDETADGSTFSLSRPDGSGARIVLATPIRSLVPLQSKTSLYAATAPAPGIAGFLFRIEGGGLTKVTGGVLGMMAASSPSGRYIAISGGTGRMISLSILDTRTGTLYDSPLATIVSKCAWVSENPPSLACGIPQTFPAGAYPTDWLVGRISFSDDLWLVEPLEGTASLLADPVEDVGEEVDIWQPAVDESGAYLTFINKRDLSFWSFKIAE